MAASCTARGQGAEIASWTQTDGRGFPSGATASIPAPWPRIAYPFDMNRSAGILCLIVAIALVLSTARSASAYSPKFPDGPYYFSADNGRFLVEVVPVVRLSPDSKRVLVRNNQTIGLYRRGEGRTWKEVNTFRVGRLPLIKEVLVSNDGETLVVRIDENPMARNTNREDGVFIYARDGKRLGAHSHFSIFGRPGNFRNIEVRIDNVSLGLVFVGKDGEVRKQLR